MSTKPNEELTPFEKAGYTEVTKFIMLRDYLGLKKGEVVTLKEDDGRESCYFETEDGEWGCMWLPSMAPEGYDEDLEVYTGDKQYDNIK